eukprot:6183118-Pleurochrysis_carterae.AAC.2
MVPLRMGYLSMHAACGGRDAARCNAAVMPSTAPASAVPANEGRRGRRSVRQGVQSLACGESLLIMLSDFSTLRLGSIKGTRNYKSHVSVKKAPSLFVGAECRVQSQVRRAT